jgi:phage gp36-like protein
MYVTVAELKSERGLSGGSQAILAPFEDDRIKNAIRDAESLINSRLSNLYTVPFSPVPDVIRYLTMDLALCILTRSHKAINAPDKEALSGLMYVCDEAFARLRELANGDMRLPTVELSRGTQMIIDPGRTDWWSPTDV